MRCVIVGGAKIENYAEIKKALLPDDFFIFCDSGLYHRDSLGACPNLTVGDFDSHPHPDGDGEVIALPREKDDTDTFFAVKEALRRGFSDFLLIGVIGGRLDHTLGNISILHMLHTKGATAKIIDAFSEMEIVDNKPKYISNDFSYFSVINSDGSASGITIKGALFPLSDADISPDFQYGISNEPLPGKTAEVTVARGRALLIKVR